MQFYLRGRHVDLDIKPIILSALIIVWALYYYFSTIRDPEMGVRSVAFIKPLVIGILVSFPFVVWSALKIEPGTKLVRTSPEKTVKKVKGFLDHRRIFFTVSLIAYAIGLNFLGYLIPTTLFIFSVCYYLGSRNFWVLIVLPVGLSTFLSLTFRMVLMVPVPIWPSW